MKSKSKMVSFKLILSILFLLVNFVKSDTTTNTIYNNPPIKPSVIPSYDTNTKQILFQVNAAYISTQNQLYTYVFGFQPWKTSTSTIYNYNLNMNLNTCGNRRVQDFNTTNPLPWSKLWVKSPSTELNINSIGTRYYAWPTPPPEHWQMSIGNPNIFSGGGSTIIPNVQYNGIFTIDQLAGCANTNDNNFLSVITTSTSIIYSGTFFITYLQPVNGINVENQYVSNTYLYPFVITIPTNIQALSANGILQVSAVYSFVLSVEPFVVKIVGGYPSYSVLVHVKTQIPATLSILGIILSYNKLKLSSVTTLSSINNPTGVKMYLNMSLSPTTMPDCVTDSLNYCNQEWYFYTDLLINQTTLTAIYQMNAIIYSCGILNPSCSPTSSTVGIPISIDSLVNYQGTVNIISPFTTNITLYQNQNLTIPQNISNYFANGDTDNSTTIYVKVSLNSYGIDSNFYNLLMSHVYLCYPVFGGYPPALEYATYFNQQRYGCSQVELLNNVQNIPEDNIFDLSLSLSQYQFQNISRSMATTMKTNEFGFQFSLKSIIRSIQLKQSSSQTLPSLMNIYLQVNSYITQSQSQFQSTNLNNKLELLKSKISNRGSPLSSFIVYANDADDETSNINAISKLSVNLSSYININNGPTNNDDGVSTLVIGCVVGASILFCSLLLCGFGKWYTKYKTAKSKTTLEKNLGIVNDLLTTGKL